MDRKREGSDDRLTTAVPGLDRLTRGGLRAGGLHVFVGRPGAGKSVLAHQIGAHRVREGGKVLYLTALVETHQSLIAQAKTFRFFDPQSVATSFYYASLFPMLVRQGLRGTREEIMRLIAHHGPSLVVLDGLHALKSCAEGPLDYQRFMHELEAQAAVGNVATLLLTHPEEGMASDPTFTIADGIIALHAERSKLRIIRTIEVEKLRGAGQIGGQHAFQITEDGIHIFPRLEAVVADLGADLIEHAKDETPLLSSSFAAKGLDDMMGGGVTAGSCTLVVGTPGSGKTLLGLSFLSAALESGEPGLMIGFHEEPHSLLQKADGVGLPLRRALDEGIIEISWRPAAEILSDEVVERIFRIVEERGIRRVFIDSVDELQRGAVPGERGLPFLAALSDLFRARRIAALYSQDIPRVAGASLDLPMGELSPLVDNLVLTRYTEIGSELRRLIAILKMRERGYDVSIRELLIGSGEMRVGEAIDRQDLLTGLAAPRRGTRV